MAQQRMAVVTGGMGGLGETISTKMADAGYRVVVTYSPSNTKYKSWLEEMKGRGYAFSAYPVDVADFDDCARKCAAIQGDCGPIDILVNNAGITRDGTLHRMKPEDWRAVIATNLDSLFNMTRNVIEGMRARGYGRIVSISSINGQKGQFGQANYSAAKAGVFGFTKAVAQENAAKGITVNAIAPGYIATEMVKAVPEEVLKTKILPLIPTGRLGEPEEIARCVAFLCSEQANFITGASIPVEGGAYQGLQ